jgi:hypothetical protein
MPTRQLSWSSDDAKLKTRYVSEQTRHRTLQNGLSPVLLIG